jgi:hypothetical protein
MEKDNHTTCECGNKTIYDYSWSNDDGETSCPLCMVAWQGEQITGLKKLLYELSSKSKDETAAHINQLYAEIMGVDMEYFTDMELDYSEV